MVFSLEFQFGIWNLEFGISGQVFPCPDVHSLINLAAVSRNQLTVELSRQLNCQRRLAARRRPANDQQFFLHFRYAIL